MNGRIWRRIAHTLGAALVTALGVALYHRGDPGVCGQFDCGCLHAVEPLAGQMVQRSGSDPAGFATDPGSVCVSG